MVTCKPGGCRSHEKCVIVNGIARCTPKKHYTCIGTGDPHYTTFDGVRFDFQGSCIYQFAALCIPKPTLVPFNVTVENNHRGSRAVSFTKTVNLEVYGSVISMSQDYARVILPTTYSGAVCGLCGNANGDPDDDLVTPAGHRSSDETQLGDSWKVGDVPGCSTGCGSECLVCDAVKVQPYRGDRYCGVIAQAEGPFRECHRPSLPSPPFPPSLTHPVSLPLCSLPSSLPPSFLPFFLEGLLYTLDIPLIPYLLLFFSPALSCPPHSHYELCGSPCQPTCHTPSIPASCPASPCSEGCFCDTGYVLSGSDCVPYSECGCEYLGRYYQKDTEFYPSCRERCRCNGVLGCHPTGYGRLVVSGDPHYVTFDGRTFNIPGSCTYILAQVCKPAQQLVNFTVLVDHEAGWVFALHSYTVTMEWGLVTLFQASHVTLSPFQVDLERYTLPLVTEDKNLRIGQEGNNIILHTAAGIRILYNTATFLLITVPDVYRGRLCGLGGDYDGDPSDDFRLPSGALAGTTQEFVTSWKVPEKERACSDGCDDGVCSRCDVANEATYSRNGSCGIIRDAEGPFQGCHPRVSPMEYFAHCVHDICAANGARTALCHALQAYTAACQAAGATVGVWRTKEFCPLSCPPNSHYELCTRTCDLTCAALVGPARCTWGCFEGCQCDEGFVFDGDTCVSPERCGCLHRGRYLKDHVCVTHDGAQVCARRDGQCRVMPGATLTTFDGVTGPLLASGTYKMSALCDEEAPDWFKVVMEVSDCHDMNVPVAVAAIVFVREGVISINSNMEVWVSGSGVGVLGALG
uniref:IgGFc-binding protein-like n=1 Tax=Cyanistes caeruleus TaxID=156563 RepID=A0A8C0U059_CYACU